jgi:cytidylate kinase
MKQNVIAIDGLSYVGKSTIAQSLAKLMRYSYINTGHMYRAIAKLALGRGIPASDIKGLTAMTRDTRIHFENSPSQPRTIVNDQDWTTAMDDDRTVRFAPQIASIPEIRNILTEQQRAMAQKTTIIMEGRDIGTVVFPHAKWKFFISASFEIRVRRMYKRLPSEMKAKISMSDPAFLDKLRLLDAADLNRPVAPLRRAEDAIEYDNSNSPTEEEDALILYYCLRQPDTVRDRYIAHDPETLEKARCCYEKNERSSSCGKHSRTA